VWPQPGFRSVCAFVRPSVSPEQTLLARFLEYYWTEFHQSFTIDVFWDKDERFRFWDQKVKTQGSRSWWGQICGKLHFLALLARYISSVSARNFTKPSDSRKPSWIQGKDERSEFWGQKVKCAGGDIIVNGVVATIYLCQVPDFLIVNCVSQPVHYIVHHGIFRISNMGGFNQPLGSHLFLPHSPSFPAPPLLCPSPAIIYLLEVGLLKSS